MIVLDSDVVTLLSYGRTDKLRARIAALPASEDLAITVVTRMEILRGRFDTVLKAANDDELLKGMERFRSSQAFLDSFRLLDVNDAAAQHVKEITKPKKDTSRQTRAVFGASV